MSDARSLTDLRGRCGSRGVDGERDRSAIAVCNCRFAISCSRLVVAIACVMQYYTCEVAQVKHRLQKKDMLYLCVFACAIVGAIRVLHMYVLSVAILARETFLEQAKHFDNLFSMLTMCPTSK